MTILVVDDETDIQTLFEQRFRREIREGTFVFSFCHSGEEALQYLHQHASEAVLILSDINMPGMSGLELLSRIREQHPMPPPFVVMITAYGGTEKRQEALQLGANDFLDKPLDFISLKQKLALLT